MLVPIIWLKEFVDIDLKAEKLADLLTISGLEVERVFYPMQDIKNVLVGKIVKIEKHPNADRLVVCLIDCAQKELLTIITAAKNVQEGDMVPVAVIGAELVGGFKITKVNFRGLDSFGMLCSEKELGLAEDALGIMQLPKNLKIGQDFKQALGLDEAVLDISVLPNRSDCLSIIGIAREISAILNIPLKEKKINQEIKKITSFNNLEVNVLNYNSCFRYLGTILDNIKIASSPLWLQQRLKLAGIRSINNVVDITNYILIEYGQPMHAFDFDKIDLGIDSKKIIVRDAMPKEKITIIDQSICELDKDDLVISDTNKALAIAGVMGGDYSEITETTKTIFLESAFFNPINIRKTAKKFGLKTESSYRFERGLSFSIAEIAIKRAIELMQELAGATIKEGIIDLCQKKQEQIKIPFDFKRAEKLLGIKFDEQAIIEKLKKIGFILENDYFFVPEYRYFDVTREADLLEEIARLVGYEKIEPRLPKLNFAELVNPFLEKLEAKIKQILLGQGQYEIITRSLVSEAMVDKELAVKLKNPLSLEEAFLRTSLLPSILKTIKLNNNFSKQDLSFFEIGKVYFQKSGKIDEQYKLAMAIAGENADFFQLKNILQNMLLNLKINDLSYHRLDQVENLSLIKTDFFHPGKSALIKVNNDTLGVIGTIHPSLAQDNICLLEIDYQSLLNLAKEPKYCPLPKFPASRQDIAFIVSKDIFEADIIKLIKEMGGNLVESAYCFDRYEGDAIKNGFLSTAYAIIYRDNTKTLVEKDIIKLHQKIADAIKENFKVEFR